MSVEININGTSIFEANSVGDIYASLLVFVALPLILLAFAFLLWFFFGRDDKIIEVVHFDPPKDINPLEAAYLYSKNIGVREVAYLLYYLAGKGYIKIEDNGNLSKKWEPDKSSNTKFTLLKPYDGDDEIEAELIEVLFSRATMITIDDISKSSSFYKFVDSTRTKLKEEFVFFNKSSLRCQKLVTVLTIITFFLMNAFLFLRFGYPFDPACGTVLLILGYLSTINHFISHKVLQTSLNLSRMSLFSVLFILIFALVLFPPFLKGIVTGAYISLGSYLLGCLLLCFVQVFIFLMPQISYKGHRVYGQILGYRKFLSKVKIREIEQLTQKNSEKMYMVLPYAMVFGLSRKWMNKFINSNLNVPEWYTSEGWQIEILGQKFASFEQALDYYSTGSTPQTRNFKGHYRSENGGVIW